MSAREKPSVREALSSSAKSAADLYYSLFDDPLNARRASESLSTVDEIRSVVKAAPTEALDTLDAITDLDIGCELALFFPIAHVFRHTHPAMRELEVPQVPAWAEANRPLVVDFLRILDAELGTRPLRNASATDRYVLHGDGEEVWRPRWTFHGFRYVQVDNWPGEVETSNFTALVIHSEMNRIGDFRTSHELLQRLHDNVVWSTRGNFLSVPRTVRNATSASAGPATFRSSLRRRRFSTTAMRSCAPGSSTL